MIFCIIFIKISYKRRSRLQDLSEGRRGFGRLSINVLWAWLRQQSGRRAASMWLQVLLVLLRPLQNLRPQSRDQPMSLATLPLRSLSLSYLLTGSVLSTTTSGQMILAKGRIAGGAPPKKKCPSSWGSKPPPNTYRNVRRILVRGSMPPCCLRRRKFWKFDYEIVHSEVYMNKYVVSTAPFSTPACRYYCQNITWT